MTTLVLTVAAVLALAGVLVWGMRRRRGVAADFERPKWGTEDYRRYAVLFNDITHARLCSDQYIRFSDRHALADYLWAQGWRRDVRPEDVTR